MVSETSVSPSRIDTNDSFSDDWDQLQYSTAILPSRKTNFNQFQTGDQSQRSIIWKTTISKVDIQIAESTKSFCRLTWKISLNFDWWWSDPWYLSVGCEIHPNISHILKWFVFSLVKSCRNFGRSKEDDLSVRIASPMKLQEDETIGDEGLRSLNVIRIAFGG